MKLHESNKILTSLVKYFNQKEDKEVLSLWESLYTLKSNSNDFLDKSFKNQTNLGASSSLLAFLSSLSKGQFFEALQFSDQFLNKTQTESELSSAIKNSQIKIQTTLFFENKDSDGFKSLSDKDQSLNEIEKEFLSFLSPLSNSQLPASLKDKTAFNAIENGDNLQIFKFEPLFKFLFDFVENGKDFKNLPKLPFDAFISFYLYYEHCHKRDLDEVDSEIISKISEFRILQNLLSQENLDEDFDISSKDSKVVSLSKAILVSILGNITQVKDVQKSFRQLNQEKLPDLLALNYAKAYFSKGQDSDSALGYLKSITKESPFYSDSLKLQSEILSKQKKFEDVAAILKLELIQESDNSRKNQLLFKLSNIYENHLEDHQAALDSWKKIDASSFFPSFQKKSIALLYYKLSDWENFIQSTREEIEASLNNTVKSDLYYSLGKIYQTKLRDSHQASLCFESCLSLNEDHQLARLELIALEKSPLKRFKYLKKVLQSTFNEERLFINNVSGSMESFIAKNQDSFISPDDRYILEVFQLIKALKNNDYSSAQTFIKKALGLKPDSFFPLLARTFISLKNGEYKKSLSGLVSIEEKHPVNFSLAFTLGLALLGSESLNINALTDLAKEHLKDEKLCLEFLGYLLQNCEKGFSESWLDYLSEKDSFEFSASLNSFCTFKRASKDGSHSIMDIYELLPSQIREGLDLIKSLESNSSTFSSLPLLRDHKPGSRILNLMDFINGGFKSEFDWNNEEPLIPAAQILYYFEQGQTLNSTELRKALFPQKEEHKAILKNILQDPDLDKSLLFKSISGFSQKELKKLPQETYQLLASRLHKDMPKANRWDFALENVLETEKRGDFVYYVNELLELSGKENGLRLDKHQLGQLEDRFKAYKFRLTDHQFDLYLELLMKSKDLQKAELLIHQTLADANLSQSKCRKYELLLLNIYCQSSETQNKAKFLAMNILNQGIGTERESRIFLNFAENSDLDKLNQTALGLVFSEKHFIHRFLIQGNLSAKVKESWLSSINGLKDGAKTNLKEVFLSGKLDLALDNQDKKIIAKHLGLAIHQKLKLKNVKGQQGLI